MIRFEEALHCILLLNVVIGFRANHRLQRLCFGHCRRAVSRFDVGLVVEFGLGIHRFTCSVDDFVEIG